MTNAILAGFIGVVMGYILCALLTGNKAQDAYDEGLADGGVDAYKLGYDEAVKDMESEDA